MFIYIFMHIYIYILYRYIYSYINIYMKYRKWLTLFFEGSCSYVSNYTFRKQFFESELFLFQSFKTDCNLGFNFHLVLKEPNKIS